MSTNVGFRLVQYSKYEWHLWVLQTCSMSHVQIVRLHPCFDVRIRTFQSECGLQVYCKFFWTYVHNFSCHIWRHKFIHFSHCWKMISLWQLPYALYAVSSRVTSPLCYYFYSSAVIFLIVSSPVTTRLTHLHFTIWQYFSQGNWSPNIAFLGALNMQWSNLMTVLFLVDLI